LETVIRCPPPVTPLRHETAVAEYVLGAGCDAPC
jgi:hypothetical protein